MLIAAYLYIRNSNDEWVTTMAGIKNMQQLSDEQILSGVQNSDYNVFTFLYLSYFENLSLASLKYVKDSSVAEEIVQDVFIKLWEEPSCISAVQALKPYLYRTVINLSINYVNRKKSIEQHHLRIAEQIKENDIEDLHEAQELKKIIYQEIERLPPQCRKIFKMSRFEGLKYREIAYQLNISENTVENHMSAALKMLRSRLLTEPYDAKNTYRFRYMMLLLLISGSGFAKLIAKHI